MPVNALDQVLFAFDSAEDVMTLACTTSIVPSHTAQSIDSPVEVGSDITDHVRVNPRSLSLTIFLSELVGQEENETFDPDFAGDHIKFRERLIQGLEERDPVTVDLGPDKGVYANMILLDVSPIWTEGEGKSPTITLQLKEIVYATTKTRSLAPASAKSVDKLPPPPKLFDQGGAAKDFGLINPRAMPTTDPLMNQLEAVSRPAGFPDWARL